MDITAPKTYARAVDAARRVEERPGREQRNSLSAFQGALAIIERARISRAIDTPTAERLVLSLADAVDRDDRHARGSRAVDPCDAHAMRCRRWCSPISSPDRPRPTNRRSCRPWRGRPSKPIKRAVEWEGLSYRVDLAAGERQRLARIREQVGSPGLDAALASGQAQQIADALLALIYTPALGDPEGAALLSTDIATRHDFGLDAPAIARRDALAWTLPRDQVGDGGPWHIQGAIVGLDLGLARLALRRIVDNEMPAAPTINLNDQITLSRTVVALNPREMRDRDRDRLVEAIGARPCTRGCRDHAARCAGARGGGAASLTRCARPCPGCAAARPRPCLRCLRCAT